MYPTLDVLGHHVDLYLLMIGIAVVVANRLGVRIAEKVEGIPRPRIQLVLLVLAFAAFAGARTQYVWNTWGSGNYIRHPLSALSVWDGLHAGGGLFAFVIALPLAARWQRISLGSFADAIVPTAALGLGIVRLGCFLHGCCFGEVTNLPWAVSFPQGSPAASFHVSSGVLPAGELQSAPVHPLQLYLFGSGLIAALAAFWMQRHRAYPGRVALAVAAVFLTLNAVLEQLRAPFYPPLYFWGARLQFEWIAVGLAAFAVAGLTVAEIRRVVLSVGAARDLRKPVPQRN